MCPPLLTHRLSTFPHLSPELKDRYLETAVRHRSWAIRELTGFIRLTACLAYFADADIRARLSESHR